MLLDDNLECLVRISTETANILTKVYLCFLSVSTRKIQGQFLILGQESFHLHSFTVIATLVQTTKVSYTEY
jgi:hypothetical protein